MLDSSGRGSEGNALRIFSSLESQLRCLNLHAMLGFSSLLYEGELVSYCVLWEVEVDSQGLVILKPQNRDSMMV